MVTPEGDEEGAEMGMLLKFKLRTDIVVIELAQDDLEAFCDQELLLR